MDNADEFEDLVQELDTFERDAKELQERVARLMHRAREVFSGSEGDEAEAELAAETAEG